MKNRCPPSRHTSEFTDVATSMVRSLLIIESLSECRRPLRVSRPVDDCGSARSVVPDRAVRAVITSPISQL